MKKNLAALLIATLTLAGCSLQDTGGGADIAISTKPKTSESAAVSSTPATPSSAATESAASSETLSNNVSSEAEYAPLMDYEAFMAAADKDEVTIEAYVQAKQSWWDNKATVYTQDADGAYFLYEMACSQEQYNKLVPGTKIKVNGTKTTWSGEVEIMSAQIIEIDEAAEKYVADFEDVTSLVGTDNLVNYMNQAVMFRDAKVLAQEGGAAYTTKDKASDPDLYFSCEVNGTKVDFCVENYLTGPATDVYKAVQSLTVGEYINIDSYLYWYNGANPHVVNIQKTMSYTEFVAAEKGSTVAVETYVQAKQSWWSDKATIYTQNEDGAYFIYELPCSQEVFNTLVPGTKIRVTGTKAEWSGEVEITNASFSIIDGSYTATATDVTSYVASGLDSYMNQLVKFTNGTVVAQTNGDAYTTKDSAYDPDLYFAVKFGETTINFCVENYLTGPSTDVYKAVQALQVGDTVSVEGFLYWYNGANPHATKVTKEA